jgi:ribosomal protein S1
LFSRDLRVGDSVTVRITGVDCFDPERVRISASEKEFVLNEMVTATKDGSWTLGGKVDAVKTFGLIVGCPKIKGFSALIHISEIPGYYPGISREDREQLLGSYKAGDGINFSILGYERVAKRNEHLKKDVMVWSVRASAAYQGRRIVEDGKVGEVNAEAIAASRSFVFVRAIVDGAPVVARLSRTEVPNIARGDGVPVTLNLGKDGAVWAHMVRPALTAEEQRRRRAAVNQAKKGRK